MYVFFAYFHIYDVSSGSFIISAFSFAVREIGAGYKNAPLLFPCQQFC